VDLTRGVYSEPQETLLTTRALTYLSAGPADVVDLIGHICSLPGAPRIVAEHMAQAMFAGRSQFVRAGDGRWMLAEVAPKRYEAGHGGSPTMTAAAQSLRGLSYVVVDTETTGGRSWLGDRITEIAAVVVQNGEIVQLFETLVNPQRSIPPFITQLTNITWDMVKDAPTFDRVACDVLRVLEGNVFVAHNATFDWRFVSTELSRSTGRQLVGRRLCTVKMARKVLPQLSRRSLDHVARYYGVEIRNRHRAGGDALATAKCLVRMLADLEDRGCGTWGDLQSLLRTPSLRRKKRRASGLPTPVTRDTTA
jgi:DNA polymerase-3 subunit epsilon